MSSIFFSTANQTFIPSLNLLGYRGLFVLLMLVTVIFSLLASTSLVYWGERKAEIWQTGQILGQAFLGLIAGFIFFKLVDTNKKRNTSSELLRLDSIKIRTLFFFVWPLAISVLLTWVQTQSYRFIVQDLIGLQALGLFAIGYGLSASLFGIFESVLSTYFIPNFYQRLSEADKHEHALAWSEYASVMLPSMLIIISVCLSVSDALAFILLDAKFSSAAQYVIWGALAETARVTVGTYALIAHAGMNTKKLVLPNILGAVSAPIFVFVCVPVWGVSGVGVGLAVAGGVAIISSHVFLSKSFEIIMPWSKLALASLFSILIVVLAQVGRLSIGYPETLISSLSWLLVVGLIMLIALFILLKDNLAVK
jgi:O-antigen/teichoic acid export membrane protein